MGKEEIDIGKMEKTECVVKEVIDSLEQEIINSKFKISQAEQRAYSLEKLKLPEFARGGVLNGHSLPFIL